MTSLPFCKLQTECVHFSVKQWGIVLAVCSFFAQGVVPTSQHLVEDLSLCCGDAALGKSVLPPSSLLWFQVGSSGVLFVFVLYFSMGACFRHGLYSCQVAPASTTNQTWIKLALWCTCLWICSLFLRCLYVTFWTNSDFYTKPISLGMGLLLYPQPFPGLFGAAEAAVL